MDASGLLPLLASADVVITGEGSLDAQSLRGKVVAAVAAAAPCPVYAVAGRIELSAQALAKMGISRSLALVDLAPSVRSAMDDAPRWAAHAARLLTS
jgi:glycerate kinase